MHTGTILLAWFIIIVVVIVGLFASGIIRVHIEIEPKDDENKKSDDEKSSKKQ